MPLTKEEVFTLLERLEKITLLMREEVAQGRWENLLPYLQSRGEIMEKLGDFHSLLEEGEKQEVIARFQEMIRLDEETCAKVRGILHRDLLRAKEAQEKLSALRRFRESMTGPSPHRFLEKEG